MTTEIETYLNSLSEDISIIDISSKNIDYIPDLTRFKNLEKLYCHNNKLTSLPPLPQNLVELSCCDNKLTSLSNLPEQLKELYCFNNKLTSLPPLPQNLVELLCSKNQLTSLPTLPQNLEILYCPKNQLTSLPTLPQHLVDLYCSENQLTSLPTLPTQSLLELYYDNNPIYEIINNNRMNQINKNIKILNNFRYLYYCLQYKKQLRKWLWEKVREPNIMQKYHPKYLIENLGEDNDLDEVLNNWIYK